MQTENVKKRRTLYSMLVIFGIAAICFMGLMLISEDASAIKVLFVDDDGQSGSPTSTSGANQNWIKAMLDYGLVSGPGYTVVDSGSYTGNPDFTGIDFDDYDVLIWGGYYAWDYNSYGGSTMANTMKSFLNDGKMVIWFGSYAGYYYYNNNNLKDQWFMVETTYNFNTQYCYSYGQDYKAYGVSNNHIDTSEYVNPPNAKMNIAYNTPTTNGYFGYSAGPDDANCELWAKRESDYSSGYYNRNGGTAYEDPIIGYKAIMEAGWFANTKDTDERNAVFSSLMDWYSPTDREGDGQMMEPEDMAWIQLGERGHDDVTFKWQYNDPNGIDDYPMKYSLYLSRQMNDITTMAEECAMAKYVDALGEPDDEGTLNPDWGNTNPESYAGWMDTMDDPFDNVIEGYSQMEWNYKTEVGEGIEDGKWFWGVLAEEKSSPTAQRYRTVLTGSGNYREFMVDTVSPDVVIAECAPAIESVGEWDGEKLVTMPYRITSENSEEVPNDIVPFQLVIKDTVSFGITSGVDITRTMNTFEFEIFKSGADKINTAGWNAMCVDGGPTVTAIPNELAPEKVIFEWLLHEDYAELLQGTIDFYFRFLAYDNNGNCKFPNQVDDEVMWTIVFSIDVNDPMAPEMPMLEFETITDIETEYVWLGNMEYTLSCMGPSSMVPNNNMWYDITMDQGTGTSGVEFGRIKEGKDSVDWDGGGSIGFMSVAQAGLAGEYSVAFTPEVDDVAYVARAVDWADNTNESDPLEGETDDLGTFRDFVVDFDGPAKPSWTNEIRAEDIDAEKGTVTLIGEVKDIPKNMGIGIAKVEIYVEAPNGTRKGPITAMRGDFIVDETDFTKLNTQGQFEVRSVSLWSGPNKIIAVATDMLGNKGEESEPQEISRISSGIVGKPITIIDDFRVTFLQLPVGNYWLDVEMRQDPTTLAKWPSDAKIGTSQPYYWHVETNLKGGFQAEIQIDYYKNSGGAGQRVRDKDLVVIANSEKEGGFEIVSSDPPTDIGNHEFALIFTVDHFTDFVVIDPDPRGMVGDEPYAHIENVMLDHSPIIAGEKIKITAKLVNEGRFTTDSGSADFPIEVAFDARNKLDGTTIAIGVEELDGGVLRKGEDGAYVDVYWTVPEAGVYEITAQLDPNGTAEPKGPGYSIKSASVLEALDVAIVNTSYASSIWTIAIAVSVVAIFSEAKRRKR